MTRLTDNERKALREATQGNAGACRPQRPSWMVEPTPLNLQRYFRAVSQSSRMLSDQKPVRFAGANWKL
jgi:hypothetical protein